MQNDSPSSQRHGEPGRIPRRGAAAVIGTAAGLALLLGFRTPDSLPLSGVDVGGLGGPDPTAGEPPRQVAIALGPTSTAVAPPTNAATASAAPANAGSAATTPTTTPTATPEATPEATPTAKPTSSTQVVDGKTVSTRYGPVQVELTIKDGKITDAQALELPTDRQYSAEISNYVAPYLRKMVLQAQSANIDIISGATYTSTGYARSVQAALNSAR